MEPEYELLYQLNKYYKKLLVENVVSTLLETGKQGLDLQGQESSLKNVWEEICVQVQGRYSGNWEVYEILIRSAARSEVKSLPKEIRDVLEYIEGFDDEEFTDHAEAVAEALKIEILSEAADYSNDGIKTCLLNLEESEAINEDEEDEIGFDEKQF